MRTIRWLPLILIAVLGGGLLAGTAASASRGRIAKETLTFYFKATGTHFTNSSGKAVSPSKVAAGDHVYATVNAYLGTAKHHATNWTGSAFEYCGITKVVSKKDIEATCDYALAVGGSLVAGIHAENIAATVNTYPITAGTGKWANVKSGAVKTKATDAKGDANAVVTIG